MERKLICITNKDGAMAFKTVENFRCFVKCTPGVTLKDGTLYVEHDENVPYYNSELGDAIIKELKKDTPVAAFFRAILFEVSEASYNHIGAGDLENQLRAVGKRFCGYAPEIHAVSGYKTVHVVDTYSVEEVIQKC
jgi:hypothetical protein